MLYFCLCPGANFKISVQEFKYRLDTEVEVSQENRYLAK